MADFVRAVDFPSVIISTLSNECLGYHLPLVGLMTNTGAWPTANTAIYIPFRVAYPVTILQMFWQNGGTVAGNVDVGIYATNGTKLVSSGSTAMSGANAIQSVDTTDTLLNPGLYYMAMSSDSSTATFRRAAPAMAGIARAAGVYSEASAFALPTTATFAGTIVAYIPMLCLTTKAIV